MFNKLLQILFVSFQTAKCPFHRQFTVFGLKTFFFNFLDEGC